MNQYKYKMYTTFINFENSKTPKLHVLILKLTDKIDLKEVKKALLYQILVYTIHGKTFKNHTVTVNLKCQLQHGMINLNYPIDHILYHFARLFWVYRKKQGEKIDNPSVRIYVNRIENRITFKFKTGYYLESLTPEAMKLLGSTENINN